MIFCDRNNTPDVWSDIISTVKQSKIPRSSYKTIILVPEQTEFDHNKYVFQNPIAPQFIYECIKRIFSRNGHSCLSGDCKPKVVEVLLKFSRLYDDCDFNCDKYLHKYFDNVIRLDFARSLDRHQPLLADVENIIIDSFNSTPQGFISPSDEKIENVINAVLKQIEMDKYLDKMHIDTSTND
jgi:hypothetical protein